MEYVHVRLIHEQINEVLEHSVNQATISANLSQNGHLFLRMSSVRGLWGLVQWEGKVSDIDTRSLALAIEEDDWVIKVLKEEGVPLTLNE